MSNNSRVYRNSLTDKILLGFGTVMFAFLAYVAWVNQFGYENRMVIAFLMFAVLCLVGFLFSFYSVTLTEKEIIARRFFRESKLLWSDIYEVIPDSLDSFSLSDRNGDVKVFISSQVKDYVELVGLIKQSRPDIWEVRNTLTVQDTQAFHKNPWSAIQYSLIGVGMIVTSLVAPSDGRGNELIGRLFLFSMGLIGIIVLVAKEPRKLTFQGSYLIISYYGGWKKSLHINHIKEIFVRRDKVRGTSISYLQLQLENGKKITFSGYKEGMPILASAFEK